MGVLESTERLSANHEYHALLTNARELFELVSSQQWDQVVARQAQLLVDFHHLKKLGDEPVNSEDERLERRALIKEFFQVEAKARAALMRRRDELREIIEGADKQRPNGYGGSVTGMTYGAADVFRNNGA